MIIGKKEQERLEREQCAQISLLCRQKLMGYAESFEELGKSFRQEIQITGEDRQNILEKCMLWQSRQIMGDHLQEVARIMERVAGEELGYCPLEEKKRKSLVQALKSEGIIARDLCYVEKDGSSSGTEAGISMTLSTEKRHYKAAQVADMLTVLLGKKLQVSSGSPYLVEQEPHCFLFTEEPKYIALTGVSRAVKEGEKVSGDQYATMESEKGKLILLFNHISGGIRLKLPADLEKVPRLFLPFFPNPFKANREADACFGEIMLAGTGEERWKRKKKRLERFRLKAD